MLFIQMVLGHVHASTNSMESNASCYSIICLTRCDGHYSIATPLRPLSVPDSEVLRLLLRPDALNNLDLLAAGQLSYLSHRVLGLMDTYLDTKARVT